MRRHDQTGAGHASVKQKFERAKNDLLPAFKSEWFYILVGLGVGFLLLGLSQLLEHIEHAVEHHWPEAYLVASGILTGLISFVAFISEHLGVGFVVSAIAVFFYEWGAHIKSTMELGSRLESGVGKVHDMMEVLELNKRLKDISSARGKASLEAGLRTLLSGKMDDSDKPRHLRESVENIEGLVHTIALLNDDDAWANAQFIGFISNHIKVARENAEALRYLTEHGERRLTQLTTTTAAEIVTAMMQATGDGDEFMVVSDLPSWQHNQLKMLHDATQVAVNERNVRVRRVFKLLSDPYGDPPREAEEMLLNHLRDSKTWRGASDWGRYEVGVLTGDSLKNEEFVNKFGATRPIIQAHFGIFMHEQESTVVRVESPTFSDMVLSGDERTNSREFDIFAAIWDVAVPLTDEAQVPHLVSKMRTERVTPQP